MRRERRESGISLTELLVVLGLIGVVSTFTVYKLMTDSSISANAQEQATRKVILQQIAEIKQLADSNMSLIDGNCSPATMFKNFSKYDGGDISTKGNIGGCPTGRGQGEVTFVTPYGTTITNVSPVWKADADGVSSNGSAQGDIICVALKGDKSKSLGKDVMWVYLPYSGLPQDLGSNPNGAKAPKLVNTTNLAGTPIAVTPSLISGGPISSTPAPTATPTAPGGTGSTDPLPTTPVPGTSETPPSTTDPGTGTTDPGTGTTDPGTGTTDPGTGTTDPGTGTTDPGTGTTDPGTGTTDPVTGCTTTTTTTPVTQCKKMWFSKGTSWCTTEYVTTTTTTCPDGSTTTDPGTTTPEPDAKQVAFFGTLLSPNNESFRPYFENNESYEYGQRAIEGVKQFLGSDTVYNQLMDTLITMNGKDLILFDKDANYLLNIPFSVWRKNLVIDTVPFETMMDLWVNTPREVLPWDVQQFLNDKGDLDPTSDAYLYHAYKWFLRGYLVAMDDGGKPYSIKMDLTDPATGLVYRLKAGQTQSSPIKISLKMVDAVVDSSHHFRFDVDGFTGKKVPLFTTGGLAPDEAWLVLDRNQNGFFAGRTTMDGFDFFGDHEGKYPSGYEDLAATFKHQLVTDAQGKRYIPLQQLSKLEETQIWFRRVLGDKQLDASYDLRLLTRDNDILPAAQYLSRVYVDYQNVDEHDASRQNSILQRAPVHYTNGKVALSGDAWFSTIHVTFEPIKPTAQKRHKIAEKAYFSKSS